MKRKYTYLFILCIIGLFSCEDDTTEVKDKEEEELVPVEAQFEARSFDGEAKQTFGIGERITFLDISLGNPDKHQWTLGNAVKEDENEALVSAYYDKVGKYPVKLNVTRSEDGETDELEVADYITIEHADVKAIIRADIPETDETIDVVVGSVVTFEDISIGLPDDANREWNIEGGTIAETKENGRVQVVQFLTGGVFSIGLKVGRTSDPNSDDSFDEIVKTDYINVVAPDPYVLVGQGEMTTVNELLIPMVRDALPFEDGVHEAFTVSVVNGSVSENIAVTNVEQIAADEEGGEAYLKLKLAAGTFNGDMITLSYDNSIAPIYAHDGGEFGGNLQSFTGHEVVPLIGDNCEFLNNTPAFSTFDVAASNNAGTEGYWAAGGNGSWMRATDIVYGGIGSMKYTGPANSRILWAFNVTDNGDIATGQYLMALRVFIPEGNDIKALYCYSENKPWGGPKPIEHTWNFENITRGKWQTVYTRVDVQTTMQKDPDCRWRWEVRAADNAGVAGEIEFYIDELRLIPLQTR